eukprot:15354253-Ditylum_brightwellii.AAC.1
MMTKRKNHLEEQTCVKARIKLQSLMKVQNYNDQDRWNIHGGTTPSALKCMSDILALPTAPCTTGDNVQSDLARVAVSVQSVVAASSGVPMAFVPSISGIQNQNKTALGWIRTKEDLAQYYKILVAVSYKVIAGMISSMTYVFVREGYGSKKLQ